MYDLKPPFVAVLSDVLKHQSASQTFERIKSTLPAQTPVEIIEEEDIVPLLSRPELARLGTRMGEIGEKLGDPALLLGLVRFDGKFEERLARLGDSAKPHTGFLKNALGYRSINWANSCRNDGKIALNPDFVCRCGWRLNLMQGCPHRCAYCGLGTLLTALINPEDYVRKLDELIDKNPWQTTFMYDDAAEAFALEPEHGAVKAMAELLGTKQDRFFVIHTKSANVDFMQDVDHRGHTIIVWSISARTQSQQLERIAGTMEERIEAARKCQNWGYTIRYKFKPIIPVINWREEIAEMVKLIFERTRPDVITLFTLCWMDYEGLTRCIAPDMLDPEFLQAAKSAADELRGKQIAPFPHEMRRKVYEFCYHEIRKYDKDIPVTLSTETMDMWKDLGPLLGYTAANYPCGCGPTSTPNLQELPDNIFAAARPVPVEIDLPSS